LSFDVSNNLRLVFTAFHFSHKSGDSCFASKDENPICARHPRTLKLTTFKTKARYVNYICNSTTLLVPKFAYGGACCVNATTICAERTVNAVTEKMTFLDSCHLKYYNDAVVNDAEKPFKSIGSGRCNCGSCPLPTGDAAERVCAYTEVIQKTNLQLKEYRIFANECELKLANCYAPESEFMQAARNIH